MSKKLPNSNINMSNQDKKLTDKDLGKNIEALYKKGQEFFKEKEVVKAEKFFNQILELTPEHKDSSLYLAKLNIHKGDYEKAIILLKKYLNEEPNSFEAKLRLSTAYIKIKNFESAIGILTQLKNTLTDNKQLLKVKENLVKVYNSQAIFFKENKNFKKALSSYEQAAKFEKNEEKKLLNFALCYKEMKNYPKAIEYFQEILKIDNKKDNFEIYFQLGIIEEIQGNNGRAIRAYQKYNEVNINNPNSPFFYGKISFLQRNYEKAIEFFINSLKTEENLILKKIELAKTYSKYKNYSESLKIYQEIIKTGKETPDILLDFAFTKIKLGEKDVPGILEKLGGIPLEENPEIAKRLGELLLEMGFIHEATQNLLMAKDLLPDDPEVRVFLSQCYKIAGNTEEAEKEIQNGIKISPNNVLVLKEIAESHQDSEKAIEIYKKMLTLEPREKEPLRFIAEVHLVNKNYKEAIASYKEYLQYYKCDADAIYNFALCYFERVEMDNAAKEFEKLVENHKYCFFAFSFLINIYISKGNMNKAMAYLQKSIQNFPTYSDNYLKFGKICIHIGQITRAIEYFKNARGLEPDNVEVKQLLEFYSK